MKNTVNNALESEEQRGRETLGGKYVYNEDVTIEPSKVQLLSPIKRGKTNKLGAVLLLQCLNPKRNWINFDDLYTKYILEPKDALDTATSSTKAELKKKAKEAFSLYNAFVDQKTKTFIGNALLGVNQGNTFLLPL